jgi:hypothetical protein
MRDGKIEEMTVSPSTETAGGFHDGSKRELKLSFQHSQSWQQPQRSVSPPELP